ncbi:MAG: cysteine desulfurase family protein [Oscillospiraceae bacterium]
MKQMQVYADNAATTKMSRTAIEAMLPYMDEIYGNPSSLHSVGQKANEALCDARERTAKLLGCDAREITFTSGGSESDNHAIISAARFGETQGKKHIISTAFEHHAVLHTLDKLEKEGYEITLLDVHENGIVRPEQVSKAIRPDTCLVSVMYANNEIGTIQPIKEIGDACKKRGVIFHTDAVQAAGRLQIDVREQNIDMLSLSAHKFHGPKGIGVLYSRKGIPLVNIIEGGAQERGKRGGTENVPAIIGMTAAFEEACGNMDKNNEKLISMRNRLIDGLSDIPHSIINGDIENRLCSNVNFCFEGVEGESMLILLDDKGISASSGSACSSGSLDPSHVMLAIGRPHEIARSSLRISLSEENTDEEIEYIIKTVREVVSNLRSVSPIWRDLINGRKDFLTK